MKLNKIYLTICISIALFAACKKEEKTPTPTQQSTPLPTNQGSAKVNGVNFTANDFSSGSSGSDFELRFENGNKQIYFASNNAHIQTGTHILQNVYDSVSVRASYAENGTYYSVKNGSINITEININTDSAFAKVKKFVATFSFNTDTIAGNSFNITNGSATYINNF